MAVVIHRIGIVVEQVDAVDVGAVQVRMVVVDTGIDDGHVDAGARVAAGVDVIRSVVLDAPSCVVFGPVALRRVVEERDWRVGLDGRHARVLLQLCDSVSRDLRGNR